MTLQEHADRTEQIVGIRAEDIHAWIDEFFDFDSFAAFLATGKTEDFDPYNHRKFRHCYEALEDAYEVFSSKYSREKIKDIFECHLKDDYNGYIPFRDDFLNEQFKEKYHEKDDEKTQEAILSHQELNEYFKGKSGFYKKRGINTISKGFLLRIVLPTVSAIVLFIVLIFFMIIPMFKQTMTDRKMEMIRDLTNAAENSINDYIDAYKKGVLTREAAQKIAASEVEKMQDDVDVVMQRLTTRVTIIAAIIAGLLIIILTYILFQSHSYEKDRTRAEAGLIEIKDRYRALVDASNEGYLLEVGGKNIFSNHALQKMLGFNEAKLLSGFLWELLPDKSDVNDYPIRYLKELYAGKTASEEFEAQIMTRHDGIIDVIIGTSNIFFSQKNGHVITVRKIQHEKMESIYSNFKTFELQTSRYTFSTDKNESPTGLMLEIADSKTAGHVINALNRLPVIIQKMTVRGNRPELLKATIGSIYDATMIKFIELSMEELGEAPVNFAYLSLGSNARHEMTLFSDQDNAIIFDDVAESAYAVTKKYFLKLGESVSTKLHEAGYSYCPGGIMGSNPQWCMSKSKWFDQFHEWISNPVPDSLLKINVFFDIECTFGDKKLAKALKQHIFDSLDANPLFFIHMTNNCLSYKPPLSILGGIKAEKKSGLKTINVKECLKPIETLVRIYTLKHKGKEPGTLSRLKVLMEDGVLPEDRFREIVYVFHYLWNLRFYNQIVLNSDLKKIDDDLDLGKLTEIELKNLRNILSMITSFQTMLSYDFLGKA